jgi:molybdenum cofactor cytidylyltransferase
LIAPGDSPGLSAELVAQLIGAARENPSAVVVPTFAGKRGHPIALPASAADAVRQLPPGKGLNALLDEAVLSIVEVDSPDTGTLADLDTPEEYRRWQEA